MSRSTPTTAADIRLVAACALVDRDGRVLLAKRPPGSSWGGLWEFPGGKIKPGESPETALSRELAEELGISVESHCLAPIAFASHAHEEGHLVLLLFVCRVWDGIPAGREGQELAWVRQSDLSSYSMPPANAGLPALLSELL